MIIERITAEAPTSIPPEVLEALGLKPGDDVAFEILEGSVSLRRVEQIDDSAIDEDTGLDVGTLRAMIKEAIDDPRPPIPLAEAVARVRARLEDRWAADDA